MLCFAESILLAADVKKCLYVSSLQQTPHTSTSKINKLVISLH